MARLKFSALVSSMEGSLNGSSIQTGKNGSFLRNKAYPKQSNSKARINSVNQFSSLVSEWSALTAAQKNAWNDFTRKYAEKTKNGDKYNPGGYAHFLAVNRLRASAELPPLELPGTYTGKPYSLNFSVSEFNLRINETENIIQSLILDVNLFGNTSNNSSYVVSISQPLGKTSSQNFGTMYPIGYFRIPAGYQNQGTFSVLLPEIAPNKLIVLQPNRQYQFEITAVNDESAIYTMNAKSTEQSTALSNEVTAFVNANWWVDAPNEVFISNDEITIFGYRYGRPGNSTTLADFSLQAYACGLTDLTSQPGKFSKFFFGLVEFPAVNFTSVIPGWSLASRELAAPLFNQLPLNIYSSPTPNGMTAAYRIKNDVTNQKSNFIYGIKSVVIV